jgi:hypothetical protein
LSWSAVVTGRPVEVDVHELRRDREVRAAGQQAEQVDVGDGAGDGELGAAEGDRDRRRVRQRRARIDQRRRRRHATRTVQIDRRRRPRAVAQFNATADTGEPLVGVRKPLARLIRTLPLDTVPAIPGMFSVTRDPCPSPRSTTGCRSRWPAPWA